MRLKTDWDAMLSQRNYSTIELVSRIENRADLLNNTRLCTLMEIWGAGGLAVVARSCAMRSRSDAADAALHKGATQGTDTSSASSYHCCVQN